MEEKIIAVGKEGNAFGRFLEGVRTVNELVGGTIGPFGKNRIIYRKYAAPLVTNDGVTIARHTYLKDEISDLAAQTLVEMALKTNDVAGDGTTSCVVIGSAAIESGIKKIVDGNKLGALGEKQVSAMHLSREMRSAVPKVVELLKLQKQEMNDEKLDNVIATSLENLEYGKEIGKMMREVGKDGYVSVEDNWATKYGVEFECTKGMRFLGTYASPYIATSEDQKHAIWEDSLVLVTNNQLESLGQIAELLKEMQAQKKYKLVIIGGFSEGVSPFSKSVIANIASAIQAAAKGGTVIQILAIKAPSLTSAELEDVACFANAKFIDKALDMKYEDVRFVHLGTAKKVAADEDFVNIMGGSGDTTQRIEVLKEQITREKDAMFEEKALRRIASLASGIGIIRVGAVTEQERTYLKHKIEDAVNTAKAAMEEGVVEGGGFALKKIADELGKDHVLFDALMAPYKRIRENAGMDIEVGPEIMDALKVVRVGFENAISAAAMLITCDAGIAVRRQSLADLLERKIDARDNQSDFRDDENQDLGRGSRRLS